MKRAIVLALFLATTTTPVFASAPEVSAISREPFYAALVTRAEQLTAQTHGLSPASAQPTNTDFKAYSASIRALSQDVMKAHLDLKARGTDTDLKCILKGVSLDLNIKMDAILAATTDADRAAALEGMALLLGDTVDVIVTPATADSGMDCVIEFGAG